ncbi:MAG: hypothetical protein ACYC7D_11030 [Nitrososphaerales archaeon]
MTNLIEFVQRKLEIKDQSPLTESSIFENASDLVASIREYNSATSPRDEWPYTRSKVAQFAREYTKKLESIVSCPRVLEPVSQKISILENNPPSKTIVLMSAHQPNLFAYSGVMRKIALLGYLSQELERMVADPALHTVCFFGFADHDFVHNKWVRSAEIDSPIKKDGVLRLNVKVDKKDAYLPSNKIPAPQGALIEEWRKQLVNWIVENASLAKNYAKAQHFLLGKDIQKTALQNYDDFWNLVMKVHNVSKTLAEFNSLLLSSVSIECWNLPIVFANFSDCFSLFPNQYRWFIENNQFMRKVIELNETKLSSHRISSGLSSDAGEISPLWLRCECGSKYRFEMMPERAIGNCLRCGKELTITTSEFASLAYKKPELFEPRSIFMPMAFAQALGMSCYIGGIGGLGYLLHSRALSNTLHMPFPPTPFWYSRDEYQSIERLAMLQELERLKRSYLIFSEASIQSNNPKAMFSEMKKASGEGRIPKSPNRERDLQLLEKLSSSDASNSCMIDYAINMTMQGTCEQWINFLKSDGRLVTPVKMVSAFGQIA